MSFLDVVNISKSFAQNQVLSDVNLEVRQGEILCLLGPSGCGKTTLLRIIAGLEQPDEGQILVDGLDVTDMPSHKRDFGLMFQDYVLFPHMTVGENIVFGLKMHDWPPERRAGRLAELLDLIGMAGYEDRPVYELSGGQQQRVALARSLAPNPRLLMLDEPLGALDRTLRDQLLMELRTILKRLGQTAIYVTHDQLEAFAVADRVVLMREGKIEQIGSPQELYLQPASPFAAHFLGMENILAARIISLHPPIVATPIGNLHLQEVPAGLQPGASVQLVIRPEGAELMELPQAGPNNFTFTLVNSSFRGTHTLLQVVGITAQGEELQLSFEVAGARLASRPGDQIPVHIDPEAVVVL